MKKSILLAGTLLVAQFSMALTLESLGSGTCRLNVYKSTENVALELNVDERKHTIYVDSSTYQKISGLGGSTVEINLHHQIHNLKNITLTDHKEKGSRTLVGSNLSLFDVSSDQVAINSLYIFEFNSNNQTKLALHSRINFNHNAVNNARNRYYEDVVLQIMFKKSDDGKFEAPYLISIDNKPCLLK